MTGKNICTRRIPSPTGALQSIALQPIDSCGFAQWARTPKHLIGAPSRGCTFAYLLIFFDFFYCYWGEIGGWLPKPLSRVLDLCRAFRRAPPMLAAPPQWLHRPAPCAGRWRQAPVTNLASPERDMPRASAALS